MRQTEDSLKKTSDAPIVLAMTGASGAIYAVRLLQQLALAGRVVELVISPSGWSVIGQELGQRFQKPMPEADGLIKLLCEFTPTELFTENLSERWGAVPTAAQFDAIHFNGHGDYFCKIASGSSLTAAMVICPCSGATLAGVAHALGNNLIQRAADVHLKERRNLILVPRETPLSSFQLENMLRISQAGGTILPAMPGWYHNVGDLLDLIDFVVARILDHIQIEHRLMQRWATPQ